MTRTAYFHLDPTQHLVAECTDTEGCELDVEAHHALEVRGEHSTETHSCEHGNTTIVWHELTPADHPSPACEHGCQMTVERVG